MVFYKGNASKNIQLQNGILKARESIKLFDFSSGGLNCVKYPRDDIYNKTLGWSHFKIRCTEKF